MANIFLVQNKFKNKLLSEICLIFNIFIFENDLPAS